MSKSPSSKDIELHPDAWERFERAAGVVAENSTAASGSEEEKNGDHETRTLKAKKKKS